MAHEDFVTYEQAVRLKELGFDWACNHYYDIETKEFIENHNDYSPEDSFSDCSSYDDHNGCWNCVSAPTLCQVQKWLFERHGYFLSVQYNNEKETFQCIIYKQTFTQGYYCTNESYTKVYFQGCEDIISYDPTYCLSKGITKVLELLK